MAQEFKYTAIVLGKRDVGETDRLYILYTREKGKIITIGKGTRKSSAKLAGNLETGMLAEILTVQGKGKGKITGVIPLDYFLEIKKSPELLFRTLHIFKFLGKIIPEGERDEEVFNLLLGYLKTLEKNPEKVEIITLGFIFKLLDFLGYRIEVGKCVNCADVLRPERNFFSPALGGVVCGRCEDYVSGKMQISPESIKTIRIFLRNKVENFGKIDASDVVVRNLKLIKSQFINWAID